MAETDKGAPRWCGLIAACGLGAKPSERDRLRSQTPASTAEFLAIQKRLAELEGR